MTRCMTGQSGLRPGAKAVTYLLGLALLLCVVAVIYLIVAPAPSQRYTEFYILGPDGRADGYPTSVTAGAQCELLVGVANHEGDRESYTLRIESGETLLFMENLTLDAEKTWQSRVRYFMMSPGKGQRLDLLLFKGDDSKGDDTTVPYRQLHIYVDVSPRF